MKRFIFFILSAFCCLSSSRAQQVFNVVYPPFNAVLAPGTLTIIGTTDDSVGKIELVVKSNGQKKRFSIAPSNGVFGFPVTLVSGRTILRLTALPKGLTVDVPLNVLGENQTLSGNNAFYRHPLQLELRDCETCHKIKEYPGEFKRLKPVSTCQSKQCHGDIGKAEYVHGPAGSGTCVYCHNPHGSGQPSFISRTGRALCRVCHQETDAFFDKKNVHSPVEDGDCTACHDPHQSSLKYQIRHDASGSVCFKCHDRDTYIGKSFTHDPVKQLECIVCHNPHSSEDPLLLEGTGNNVCFTCHEDKQSDLEQTHVHEPASDDCLSCHSAHTSPYESLLVKEPGKLCLDCHRDVTPSLTESIDKAKVPHKPVQEGRCFTCHEAHGSPNDKLLIKPGTDLCFTCHRTLGDQIRKAPFKHGPVEDGDCAGCHQPHGSSNPFILNTYFPKAFYVPYSPENYALCFECHNPDIMKDAHTDSLTDFRNGDLNLHYLHVHKDRKGRSCKACHEVHAGSQEKHIRKEVPFGDMWSYPIEFTKTDTGGGCLVGCHKPLKYDRTHPVQYHQEDKRNR